MRKAEQDRLRLIAAMNKQRRKIKEDRAAKVEVIKAASEVRLKRIRMQIVTQRQQSRFTVGTRRHKAKAILTPVVSKPS